MANENAKKNLRKSSKRRNNQMESQESQMDSSSQNSKEGRTPSQRKRARLSKTVEAAVVKPYRFVGSSNLLISNSYCEDDWISPDYKDEDWFFRESRVCQFCKKIFQDPVAAARCVVTHKVLRCYLCFRFYPDTETLFNHFEAYHRQDGSKLDTVNCHFCDESVPFKGVSCHVSSKHLIKRVN